MFKIIAFLFWLLFFVCVYKIVWTQVLKPYLDKELKPEEKEDGVGPKKDKLSKQ